MLYDICAPKLYTNCFIGNVTYLMSSLQIPNAMMAKIERLHIYSGFYSEEPSYVDLFGGLRWELLFTPPSKIRLINGAAKGSLAEEVALCHKAACHLEELLHHNPSAFSRLRTVSLGDIPSITWASSLAPWMENGMLARPPRFRYQYKSLARTLINTPNVAHACQSTQFGPLSLFRGANRVKNPPAVFTYHPKLPTPFCACTDALGPVILGAMNRHYYTCLYAINDETNLVEMTGIMIDIVGSVCSTLISDAAGGVRDTADSDDPGDMIHAGEDVADMDDRDDLGDTMVELYDYVRVSDWTQNSWTDPISTPRGHSVPACRPAQSLALFQEVLDEQLPPKWRGRFIFKNREDAPPCTACGLNLAEMWEDHIEEEGLVSGQILHCSQVHQ